MTTASTWKLLAILMLSLLNGCMADMRAKRAVAYAALADQAGARAESGPVCCESFREFDFQPLVAGEKHEVVLDENSPLFEFPEGKSRFFAFRLPTLVVGNTLLISQ